MLGVEMPALLSWALAFFIVLVLLGLFALILRKLGGGRMNLTGHGGRPRQARLGVVDALALDRQRQLVIVRRDGAEHLLLIGGPTDLLIEADIQRAAAPGANAPREQAEAGGRPAMRAAAPKAQIHAQPAPVVRPQLAADLPPELTPVKRGPDPRAAASVPPPPVPPRPAPAAQRLEEPALESANAKIPSEPQRGEPIPPPPQTEPAARAERDLSVSPDDRIEPAGRMEVRARDDRELALPDRPAAPLPGEPASERTVRPAAPSDRPAAAQGPPREIAPARKELSPASGEPAPAQRSAKTELSDMARRLEEALRKPFMTVPSSEPAANPPAPARPTPLPVSQKPALQPISGGAALSSPRPEGLAPVAPASDFSKRGGARTIPSEDPSGLDELEQEMKRLLGRVAAKPEG